MSARPVLFGALVMLLIFSSACSGGDDDDTSPSSSPSPATSPTPSSPTPASSPTPEAETTTTTPGPLVCATDPGTVLRIHYQNTSVDYTTLYMWTWGAWEPEKDIPSCGQDEFGAIFDVDRTYFDPPEEQTMGFKFKKGAGTAGPWYEMDRSWTEGEPWEIWVVNDDTTNYTSPDDIPLVKIDAAYWDSPTEISVEFSDTVTGLDDVSNYALDHDAQVLSLTGSGRKFTLTTSELDIQTGYTLSFTSPEDGKAVKNSLYPRDVMDAYETDVQLGAWIDQDQTWFRIWSPRATSVVLYTSSQAEGNAEAEYAMTRDPSNGTWTCSIAGNQHGLYYWFKVDGPIGLGEHFDATRPLNDPYALIALSSWGNVAGRGMVFDTSRLDPPTTVAPDGRRPLTDLVAYEVHVRDLTGHETSGLSETAPEYRRFLGFTVDDLEYSPAEGEPVSTGLAHLEELGVTAVQILPTQEFPSDPEKFNWGYFTANFFSPEGMYTTNDQGEEKVLEFKAMIDALHARGIAVILDVVFNHSAEGSDKGSEFFNFKGLDSKYYYRQDPGTWAYSNGSGVGNELATEHPMVRRFIVDCLRYYLDVYGVDGFRFDLAGLFDLDTVRAIADLANERENVYIYGEPWAASGALWGKGAVNDIEPWAVFNDDFRNTVKGSPEGTDGGFIQGKGSISKVKAAITGNSRSYGGGSAWADQPTDSLLYMDAHDNLTLADKLEVSVSGMSRAQKEARVKLGGALTLTSLGPVMLHAGVDFLRTKPYYDEGDGRAIKDADTTNLFDANSYSSSDATNNLDWELKADHRGVFEYYKGLIALRLSELGQPSRLNGPVSETYIEWLEDASNTAALGYTLNADLSNGTRRLRVLLNSSATLDATFSMEFDEAAGWKRVADSEEVDLEGQEAITGTQDVVVEPLGIRIYADGF